MKAHLLVFDSDNVALRSMIMLVDKMSEIKNWHVVFHNTICLVSELDAKVLSGKFNVILPGVRYLISEVQPEKKGGRMQESILELLNFPGPVEREPA